MDTPHALNTGNRPGAATAASPEIRAPDQRVRVFVGLYWQRYGWVAPSMQVSGLEDEYLLAGEKPKLIYLKTPAPAIEPRLQALLDRIRTEDTASYQKFATPDELRERLANDLAQLLTENRSSRWCGTSCSVRTWAW